MKIYVDGCSYTAGYGLETQYSLANLLAASGHEVVDKSRVGKSNYSMALDLYSAGQHDCYVVGWTFASRIEYQLDQQVIDGSASRREIGLGNHPNGDFLESEYQELNSRFFRYVSRFDQLSDFLIDASAALLAPKLHVFFSWEKRAVSTDLLYPKFDASYRLKDTPNWKSSGHLNSAGMTKLSEIILHKLNDKKPIFISR